MNKPIKRDTAKINRLGFILSSVHKTASEQKAARQLVWVADHAISSCDPVLLNKVSETLQNLALPLKLKLHEVSQYYDAIARHGFGKGNDAHALSLMETLSDKGPLPLRARVLLSAGSILLRLGRAVEAMEVTLDAARLSREINDPNVRILATNNLAISLAIDDDHKRSLKMLESHFEYVSYFRNWFPVAYCNYVASLAIEKSEADLNDEALNLIAVPLASPYAWIYPGWSEAQAEIKEKLLRKRLTLKPVKKSPQNSEENLAYLMQYVKASPTIPSLRGEQARIINFAEHQRSMPIDITLESRFKVLEIANDPNTTKAELDGMLAVHAAMADAK